MIAVTPTATRVFRQKISFFPKKKAHPTKNQKVLKRDPPQKPTAVETRIIAQALQTLFVLSLLTDSSTIVNSVSPTSATSPDTPPLLAKSRTRERTIRIREKSARSGGNCLDFSG